MVSSIESSPTRGGSRSELRRSFGEARSSGSCTRQRWTILVCRASLTGSQVEGKTISGLRSSRRTWMRSIPVLNGCQNSKKTTGRGG